MSLKDLVIPSRKVDRKIDRNVYRNIGVNRDTDVACSIVGRIFDYAGICLKENKSKVKISLFTKSFISGILTDNVRKGLMDFVSNMNDREIKMLLEDIQNDLKRR